MGVTIAPKGSPMSAVRVFLLFAICVGLSPKHVLHAQQIDQANVDIVNNLREAEAAFERGRPDYILARRALEQAMATDDLRLQARANLLQAQLDSAGRRYSRALPYFNRAKELTRQADQAEAAVAIEAARREASEAEAARIQAEEARSTIASTLEEERGAARIKYLAVIGVCLAILAAGLLGFLATVRKLRGDISTAESARTESDDAYTDARKQLGLSSRTALNRIRKVLQSVSARLQAGDTGGQVLAQAETINYLSQASFEQNGRHEVAMEAFFTKANPALAATLQPTASHALHLRTESMPVRLPIDQAVPIALIYAELVGNAYKHSTTAGDVLARLTKEGTSVTLTVEDPRGMAYANGPIGEGRRLIAYLADELKAKVDYPSQDGEPVRIRFTAAGVRGPAAGLA